MSKNKSMIRHISGLSCMVGVFLLLSSCQTTPVVTNAGMETIESLGIEIIPGDLTQETPIEPVTPVVEVITPPQPAIQVQQVQDQVRITYANPILQLQSDAFSPNGDGFRDYLEFYASIPVTEGLVRWELDLFNQARRRVFLVRGTTVLPGVFTWNGLDPQGSPVPDGTFRAQLSAFYADGTVTRAESAPFRLSRTGPQGRIIVPDMYFSPDGDGLNDVIPITLEVDDPQDIIAYRITLFDSRNSVFETYAAPGSPPLVFEWDGLNRRGEVVQGADVYRMVLELTNSLGNSSVLEASIPTDVLVFRDGDRFKIRISSITFLPFSANFMDVAPAEREANLRTLDRLVEILARFPGYRIGVEGHAVQVYWNDPVRGVAEQRDALLPLSLSRAQAIRQALISRGVAPNRLTATGIGGIQPVVPHSDLQNRWKNRRVEFTLSR